MFMSTLSYDLVMPALTYAEVLVHPTKAGKAEQFERHIAGRRLEVKPFADSGPRKLAGIRAASFLRVSDAVVMGLALAEEVKLPGVITETG